MTVAAAAPVVSGKGSLADAVTEAKSGVLDGRRAIRKSYKKECQERNLPHRLNTAYSCLGIQPPHCLGVRSCSGRVILFRLLSLVSFISLS